MTIPMPLPQPLFQTGEIVRLKSGGPKMTVISMGEEVSDYCLAWFDGAELKRDVFNEACLERIS